MALGLRSAVDGVMLGTGRCLHVLAVTLERLDKRNPNPAGQIGVFAVGFLTAPPARIAEDIDIGCPEGQSIILFAFLPLAQCLMVFGTPFIGNHGADLVNQIKIPTGCHADGLGKDSGNAGSSHTMQALVPPVVGRNP